jgi:hypothetical protein
MSYKGLINSNLNLALKLLKDLAEEVDFVKKTSSDFNFGTGLATSTSETITNKIIVVKKKTGSKDRNVKTMEILTNTEAIGSLSLFDSIVYNNETWKITESILDDGYISLFNVVRETSNG